MPRLVWVSPTNFKTQYVTALVNDPNVPSGYILTSGSDGAPDEALQQYVAGLNSGGFPAYTGDATQATVAANLKALGIGGSGTGWINGILGGGQGGR